MRSPPSDVKLDRNPDTKPEKVDRNPNLKPRPEYDEVDLDANIHPNLNKI